MFARKAGVYPRGTPFRNRQLPLPLNILLNCESFPRTNTRLFCLFISYEEKLVFVTLAQVEMTLRHFVRT